MKNTFIKREFLACIITLFAVASSFAQTIVTGAVTPAAVCAGESVSVPFTSASIPTGTSYTLQISNASGVFTTPIATATGTTSPISVVLPTSAATGAGYKARVISVTPAVTGTESATFTINAIPAAPTTTATLSYAVGAVAPDLTATGTALKWYDSADAPLTGAPTPTTTAAGTQTYKVSQTVGGCESAKAIITVNITCAPPAAPTTTASLSYTVGAVALPLTATGTALKWYSSTDAPLSGAPTPTTTTAGTQTYKVSQTVGGCESAKAIITVTITACVPPAAPATTASLSYTVGAVAPALTATGTALKWYDSADSPLSGAPTPTTTIVGTQTYKVSQTVGGCESAKAIITVTITACVPPAAPATTASLSYTVGAVAPALTATGTALKWYDSADSPLSGAPTPTTTTAGTQTYKVSQTIGGCESAKAVITVTITACPASAAPTIAASFSFCASTTPGTALLATGTAVKWYSAVGTALPSAPVPNLNVSSTTSTIYFVTQTEAGKCESARKEITVTVHKTPAPGVSADVKEYCLNETATALTATGTALKWYSSTTGTTTVSPIPVTSTAGNQIFYVSQTLNGCESERARVDVKVKPRPAAPTVTALAPVCKDATVASSVLLAAVTPKTSLLWYTSATGETGTATVPTVVTAASGPQSYFVTQTINDCESPKSQPLVLDVKPLPVAPTVVTPVPYCKDVTNATALTAAVTAAGNNLKWYTVPDKGTALTAAPKPSTTTVGTTSYYVSQTSPTLGCESPRAELKVVINPLPAAPAPIVAELCQEKEEETYTFPENPTPGNSIVWYTAATGTASALPNVSLKTPGETTIYSVQKTTATGCESPTRTVNKMRVKALPALPGIAAPLIEYCQFEGAKPLSATPLSGANLNWFGLDATGGTSSGTAPTPSTADGGTKSYYVAQTLEGCIGDRAKIDVQINTTPKPVTQTYLAYCQGEQAPRLDATGTILKWYRQATDTEFQGFPYTPFTEKVEDYSFWVTQTGENKCESPKEEIKIHIKPLPSATISGSREVSLGEQAEIRLTFTGDGPWKYILSSGVTGTATQSPATVNVTPSTTTTYFVTEVSNECGKGSPIGSAQITVKVPTIITGSPSVAETCAGTSFTVPFQKSGDFPAANTFKVQIALVNEDAAFYNIPSVPGENTIVATFPDTTAGGSYFVRVVNSGANPAFTAKGSVNTVGIAAIPLPVATISGTQTVLIGSPATLKVDITGKGPWTFTLSDGSKDSVITATTSPYSFLISPKVTSTYTIKTVSNTCGVGKGAGSARVQVDPILGIEPPVTDWLKVYPTVTNSACTVEITTAVVNRNAKVQIIDLNGRPVHEETIRQKSTELDFSKYPAGLYLIQVQNGNLRSVNRVMKP
jgi:hypothetical protein